MNLFILSTYKSYTNEDGEVVDELYYAGPFNDGGKFSSVEEAKSYLKRIGASKFQLDNIVLTNLNLGRVKAGIRVGGVMVTIYD